MSVSIAESIQQSSAVKTTCPVCNGILDFVISRNDCYSIYRCSECTHISSLPIPSLEELNEFYNGFLFAMPKEPHETRVEKINKCVHRIVDDCRRLTGLKPPYSVLDWGGGLGYYSNGFAEIGCPTTMMDLDPQACRYAQEKFPGRFEILVGDPVTYDFSQKFDMIFCTHVIEHCPDLTLLFKAFKNALKPDGVLILSTPNQECKEFYFRVPWAFYYIKNTAKSLKNVPRSASKFIQTPWLCCDPPRHLHGFNCQSISTLVKTHGFNSLAAFTEYNHQQFYQFSETAIDWKVNSLKSAARVPSTALGVVGVKMMSAFFPKKPWGNNLVSYAQLPS